jgi:hypothetical protein
VRISLILDELQSKQNNGRNETGAIFLPAMASPLSTEDYPPPIGTWQIGTAALAHACANELQHRGAR